MSRCGFSGFSVLRPNAFYLETSAVKVVLYFGKLYHGDGAEDKRDSGLYYSCSAGGPVATNVAHQVEAR